LNSQGVSEHGITVNGNEVTTIEGVKLILTGNITIKDQGILIIKTSTIQFSIRGEKNYNITIIGDGVFILENSELVSLSTDSCMTLQDRANLTVIAGSKIKGFKTITSSANSTITVWGGELETNGLSGKLKSLKLENAKYLEGSINVETDDFNAKRFSGETVTINCQDATLIESTFGSLTLNASNNVKSLKIEAEEATINTGGEFKIENSTFDTLTLKGDGEVYNVVTQSDPTPKAGPKAGGQIFVQPNSTTLRFWYLTVTVKDVVGVTLPANIMLYDINGTEVLRIKADILGRAYTPILCEKVNASETIFIGNYKVQAEYMGHLTLPKPLTMDINKEITLEFNEVIPIPTATYLRISDLNARVGSKLKILGWIEPRMGGELIEITYKNPYAVKISRSFITLEDGSFSDEFTPDVSGEWVVYAEWLGGSAHVEDKLTTSRPTKFSVLEKPSLQTIMIKILPIFIIVITIIIALAYLAIHSRGKK